MKKNQHIGVILIGDELLSGQVKDANLTMIAHTLNTIGAFIKEVSIIPDQKPPIKTTLLRHHDMYDYVITTGGIGPTHDDITLTCIAEAFNIPLTCHLPTYELLAKKYQERNLPFNHARQKMCYLPQGATPIPNTISLAPGSHLHNIFSIAGVPEIARNMMQYIVQHIPQGDALYTQHIFCSLFESDIASYLEHTLITYPAISIGVYPHNHDTFPTEVVLKSSDQEVMTQCSKELIHFIQQNNGNIKIS